MDHDSFKASLVSSPPARHGNLERQSSFLDSPQRLGGKRAHRQQPFIIGVAGGTASGKTTVCDLIIQRLQEQSVVMLAQDSFYRNLTPEELQDVKAYNFDKPEAFDTAGMLECLEALRNLQPYDVPLYDFSTHQRSKETHRVLPADVIIVEGILVLHMAEIREMLNMKIYVDTDDDVRLARRIQRDVAVRGRDVGGVIEQYTSFVKPAFDQFVAPSRKHADVIIPWARGDNVVAIDLITEHIRGKLQQHDLRRIYPNLEVIPSNFQIRGMHTIIRDESTETTDFVFYADRLLRLVVEAGLGHLPFQERAVVTPTGHQYVGVEFAKKLCGVSIIRSGESMENALRACCKGIKIGKILVHREKVWANMTRSGSDQRLSASGGKAGEGTPEQPQQPEQQQPSQQSPAPQHRASSSGGDLSDLMRRAARLSNNGGSTRQVEQEIVYEKLPADISERYVLLMDPILASGNSAARAIEVLLSKGVSESKILFLTLIAAPEGIHRVCQNFPRLKVITSEIDQGMENLHVVPGVGEFGDRFYGTAA